MIERRKRNAECDYDDDGERILSLLSGKLAEKGHFSSFLSLSLSSLHPRTKWENDCKRLNEPLKRSVNVRRKPLHVQIAEDKQGRLPSSSSLRSIWTSADIHSIEHDSFFFLSFSRSREDMSSAGNGYQKHASLAGHLLVVSSSDISKLESSIGMRCELLFLSIEKIQFASFSHWSNVNIFIIIIIDWLEFSRRSRLMRIKSSSLPYLFISICHVLLSRTWWWCCWS